MLPIPKRIRYPLAPWAPSPQPPEEPWNTHSGLNTGHSLLIISTGPGYDYPHFTEEETKAQTCPPYALAKQQMKAHQGLADPKPALSWTPSSSCCTALGFLVPPPLGPAPCGRLAGSCILPQRWVLLPSQRGGPPFQLWPPTAVLVSVLIPPILRNQFVLNKSPSRSSSHLHTYLHIQIHP